MLTLHLMLNKRQVTVNADGRESHTFSLLDLSLTPKGLREFVENPRPHGEKLFRSLFKDESIARKALDALNKLGTIALVLESSELDGVAWEYISHDGAYLVEDFAFMRILPEKERPRSDGRLSRQYERVPLLFIPSSPLVDLNGEPMRELDIESEWKQVTQHIVRSNASFDLMQMRPATPQVLQTTMARFDGGMIAHFSGHGAVTKDGAFLLFENENGSSNPLEAREFVREVKDKAVIAFLSACQSAVAEKTEFSNLARELVKAGVPFALGMQFNLPDPFAPNISGQFYNYLAHGHSIPEAARQARRAVKRENEFHVGMIALYAAQIDDAGALGFGKTGAQTLRLHAEADVSDLLAPSGFIGRQRELMSIGTKLLEGTRNGSPLTVTLHGAGGIGKTALLRQALKRLAPSFELTLALALDSLPSLESVLGRIERFLSLPSPCSNDTKEREKIVRANLTRKNTLLGLDNFETLNYALNNKDSDEAKTAKSLHAFFRSLVTEGVKLCVTSREKTGLGGEYIEEIHGLSDQMGGRLFQDNVTLQRDQITIEGTQKVSEIVGGHPLALRLLASAFDDQGGTLEEYIENLQSHIPKASDQWTEQERHESLRASFDFTMNNLVKTEEGKELQKGLSRLSIFVSFFAPYVAAPTFVGKWPKSEEEDRLQQGTAEKFIYMLWERGLLERLSLPLTGENLYLYRLYPALNQFTGERIQPEDVSIIQEDYFRAMSLLASRSFPTSGGNGVYGSPLLSTVARFAMPDMLKATDLKHDKDGLNLLFNLAFLYHHFGGLSEALRLYEKALEISERLNELKGKSFILLRMGMIYYDRSDFDTALSLYQQSFEISKQIGDLQGQMVVSDLIAVIEEFRGDVDKAIRMLEQSIINASKLGDQREVANASHNLARIYRGKGDFHKAINLY
jgi:hypothetical protein